MVAADVVAVSAQPWRRSRFRGRGLARMTLWRLASVPPVLLAVSAGLFAAAAVSPFDPLVGYLGDRYVTTSAADRAIIAEQLGLDAPWYEHYRRWLGALLTGDPGMSRVFGQPVTQVLAERLPWTLLLTGVALAVALAVALTAGVWAGLRRGGAADRVVTGLCLAVQGIPPFVLSLTAIAVVAVGLGWLPPAGATGAGGDGSAGEVARHLVLPAAALAVSQLPWLLLAVRESVSAARGEDFVTGALVRGVGAGTIVRRHILPASLAPFVTIAGVRLPEIVVGAVLVEEIFSWPGIAAAFVRSASELDLPLLAVLTVGATGAVLLGSLLADTAVMVLDPRVRDAG